MMTAAKKKSSLLPGLAALRLVLLLIVTLCLGETRVWGFGTTTPPASGVFESVTPSSIGEFTIASGYDASDSLHAAKTAPGFRYVGEAEAQIIRNTGSIPMVDRFDNAKNVFYTNESFSSATSAQKALSLPSTPKFRVEFDMGKAPAGYGGIADPLYGQPGGGAEFILREGAGAIPSTRIIPLGR